MLHINNDVLEFLQEAKEVFETNIERETYRNQEETYIALRYGADRDCIRIYELGDSVFQLDQAIPPVEGRFLAFGKKPKEKTTVKEFLDNKGNIKPTAEIPTIEVKDFDVAWSKLLKKNGY